jgi:ABC-type multidrug transport system ATPase subunit
VFRIIGNLKSQGVTMLLVEQIAAAALNVADYGYVLENGRIAAHGPAAELRNDPSVKAALVRGTKRAGCACNLLFQFDNQTKDVAYSVRDQHSSGGQASTLKPTEFPPQACDGDPHPCRRSPASARRAAFIIHMGAAIDACPN